MGEEPASAPVPAHELPLWKRLGRALVRTVWPVAGARDDPWLAQPDAPDPDLPRPRDERHADGGR